MYSLVPLASPAVKCTPAYLACGGLGPPLASCSEERCCSVSSNPQPGDSHQARSLTTNNLIIAKIQKAIYDGSHSEKGPLIFYGKFCGTVQKDQ